MSSIHLRFVNIALIAALTTRSIAMANTASFQEVGKDAVEVATKQHNWVFAAYMLLVVLGAFFTYWLWDSGNKVQKALLAKMEHDTTKAVENARNESNEKIALLNQEADKARAEIGKTQTELAKQQERAAIAERALLELQEKNKPRQLSAEQQKQLVNDLRKFAGQRLDVFAHEQQPEVSNIGNLLNQLIWQAGWKVRAWDVTGGGAVSGIEVRIHKDSDEAVNVAAVELVKALQKVGLVAVVASDKFSGDTPPGFAITDPPKWDAKDIAPLRMHIGVKPQ